MSTLPNAMAPKLPDDLSEKVEALLAMRLRDLKLPSDIMALYRERAHKSTIYMMFNWCIGISAIVMATSIFDVQPPGYRPVDIMCRITIATIFIASAYCIRLKIFKNREHYVIIAACLLMLAIGGVFGVAVGDPAVVDGRLNMALIVISTGVYFLRIDIRYLIWLGISSTLLTAFFIAGWGQDPIDNKIQLIVFYGMTMCGTLFARSIQDIHLYQSFLLNAREEIRAKTAHEREEQLTQIAYVDKLTQVPNRRYFDEFCDGIKDETENLFPLAICMVDIDDFKGLNDSLGHLRGDGCLTLVAAAIRATMRDRTEILARYGGEEFIILLPRTSLAGALRAAERARAAVFNLTYPNPASAVAVVTASFGVAVAAAPPLNIQGMIARADAALYRAKTQGRNCVVS